MKRLIPAFAVLLFMAVAAPLFAGEHKLVDDVIRMSKAGVSDDSIITFVESARGRLDVSADDVIAMTQAGLSKPVVKAVMDEASARNDGRSQSTAVAAQAPGPYYAPYYYYPYGYYDPFFYGPRVFLNFGFGRSFHGGFGHHHR